MSANAGPVDETNPTRSARGISGNPTKIPITKKINAVAKAGNQPACIAESPTTSSEARAAKAANTMNPRIMPTLISEAAPPDRSRPAAAKANAIKPTINTRFVREGRELLAALLSLRLPLTIITT